ncbi:MAG: tRNA preQ1(34) S-adenosylmethionine ribosyltransferase-isomerase QueA, partial [Nitrospinae bacterium]|nr:tRNA preQ1(34) S-adenosylmethionine ribosyltransferase-isomerase QueA [Nitrospinota bacterium]
MFLAFKSPCCSCTGTSLRFTLFIHPSQFRTTASGKSRNSSIEHAVFCDLPNHLPARSLMVFNDTQVVPAKLHGRLINSGRPVEVLLVRENADKQWEALVKGLAKLKPGTLMEFGGGALQAELTGRLNDRAILRLTCTGNLEEVLDRVAKMPLPPYIRRDAASGEDSSSLDRKRYQTVFAKHAGAIAAPTAGLHFTPELLESLQRGGIQTVFLTLHVGVGTFQPIRCEDIREHKMEAEQFHIPAKTLKEVLRAREEGRDIVAVGSTSTRVLESVDLGTATQGNASGWTDRFIYPGQEFKVVNRVLTNFHLPKSTLYLFVCTLVGKDLL